MESRRRLWGLVYLAWCLGGCVVTGVCTNGHERAGDGQCRGMDASDAATDRDVLDAGPDATVDGSTDAGTSLVIFPEACPPPSPWFSCPIEQRILDYRRGNMTRDFRRASPATQWVEEAGCYHDFAVDQLRTFQDGSVLLEGTRETRIRNGSGIGTLFDEGLGDNYRWQARPEAFASTEYVVENTADAQFPRKPWLVRFPETIEDLAPILVFQLAIGQPTTPVAFSAFHQGDAWSVALAQREAEPALESDALPAASGWTRSAWRMLATNALPELRVGGVGPSTEVVLHGFQAENGLFPSQYIEAYNGDTDRRAPDRLRFDVAPDALNEPWQLLVQPAFSTADLLDPWSESTRITILGGRGDASLVFDGGRICMLEKQAGEDPPAACSLPFVWERHEAFEVLVERVDDGETCGGSVQVRMADGRVIAPDANLSLCWPPWAASDELHIGHQNTLNELSFFGRLGTPCALATTD